MVFVLRVPLSWGGKPNSKTITYLWQLNKRKINQEKHLSNPFNSQIYQPLPQLGTPTGGPSLPVLCSESPSQLLFSQEESLSAKGVIFPGTVFSIFWSGFGPHPSSNSLLAMYREWEKIKIPLEIDTQTDRDGNRLA